MASRRQAPRGSAEQEGSVGSPPATRTAIVPVPAEDPAAISAGLLSARAGERHAIAIQDYPDPDAISSALAYREIAAVSGVQSDILYAGLISHPENLALVNLLEIELIRYEEQTDLGVYDAAVFVDNQGTTSRLTDRFRDAAIPTFAVVDHHDPQDVLDPVFSDVRPVGAAATIFTEYLASNRFLQLDSSQNDHVALATALLHGIHSETNSLIHASKAEYDAAAFLSAYGDNDLLEKVLCVQKSRGTMDTIHAALGGRMLRGGLSLAGVGYLRWADRDAIPQAADFLLKEENVKTAVVYGIVATEGGQESIIGSLRTTDATLAVDAFLKTALGRNSAGRPYGGGRSRAGGFEIELDFLAGGSGDAEEREAKWALFDRQIRRKLLEAAGVDHPREEGQKEQE